MLSKRNGLSIRGNTIRQAPRIIARESQRSFKLGNRLIKFTLPVLNELGFKDEDVWTTLENRMKCGLGKCGRCNVGDIYVCKEGPVFTAARVAKMPNDF